MFPFSLSLKKNNENQTVTLSSTAPPPTPPTQPQLPLVVPEQKPQAPGTPILVHRTDTSIVIAWAETATEEPPQFDYQDEPLSEEFEFEIKYCRAGYNYDLWNSLGVVTRRKWLQISGLIPGQGYLFQCRSRRQNNTQMEENAFETEVKEVNLTLPRTVKIPSSTNKWSIPSISSTILKTLYRDEQERIDNLGRLRKFIVEGSDALERFPEDAEIPDSYGAKAHRTVEGLITAVAKTGVGGTYTSIVKNAWKIHKTGIASLIFHADLQKTLYVLLTFLNSVAGDIGLSSQDVVVGSYFAICEAKRDRLLHPRAEFEEHSDSQPGVIQSEAPKTLINELMFYFPLAGMAYRKSPAEIQWVLNKFAPHGKFRLIMARTFSAKFQPAFFLAAHEDLKTAVFVIRGTQELEDLVTDGLCDVHVANFRFGEDSRQFHVHAGMLKAAKWLVKGDDRKRVFEPEPNEELTEEDLSGAGVGAAVAKLWAGGYKQIIFIGHSLGGGVAVLAALLIAEAFRELKIKVYSYGTPAVCDETLAEACKGEHASNEHLVSGLGNRVTVKNVVRHDDIIPRLSILTARDFAIHLKETRANWGPLLTEDLNSFKERMKTVWAPLQRVQAVDRRPSRRMRLPSKQEKQQPKEDNPLLEEDTDRNSSTEGSRKNSLEDGGGLMQEMEVLNQAEHEKMVSEVEDAIKDAQEKKEKEEEEKSSPKHLKNEDAEEKAKKLKEKTDVVERLERSFSNPLAVPGLIIHTYKHHGTHLASLVDYKFPALKRISAFSNCIDDHRFDEIMLAVRSVTFAMEAREAGRLPPHWESLNDHINDKDEWQVCCRVCTYPVSWHLTSSSEAFEIGATHHCHSCGNIVCSKCSEGRVALPHIGIITPVRVCDICKYQLFEPKSGQKNVFDIEEY